MVNVPTDVQDIFIEVKKDEDHFVNEVLNDFWICCISRECSQIGRREVLTGKAKFGIFGAGKEVPQVAMAKVFKKGDWRSGYYRDQTFMFALGLLDVQSFFAQIYSDPNNDPFSGGRQMNSHFATKTIDDQGEFTDHKDLFNVSSDVSCTGGQMARGLGLAFASKKYREIGHINTNLSNNGNEVCFTTIGDSSTSEGVFWESLNAACVEGVPLAVSVWDDGYGISVPKKFQTTKSSISDALKGFALNEKKEGMRIYKCKGYDYPALIAMYEKGIQLVREEHIPALFHVEDLTQPLGHSTSGSHERYKSKKRLEWEKNTDCIDKMATWMINSGLADQNKIDEIRATAKKYVTTEKSKAWTKFCEPVILATAEFKSFINKIESAGITEIDVNALNKEIDGKFNPTVSEILQIARRLNYQSHYLSDDLKSELRTWIEKIVTKGNQDFSSKLYSTTPKSAIAVPVVFPKYEEEAELLNGYQVLNRFFDEKFATDDRLIAFGEDVGHIGDVNQGFSGLQEKYGKKRIFDAGIREWTIMGQALGCAMRGFRPIAEIQYLDYLLYGLEPLSDDLATLRYRSNGIQAAPAIIRTRGHRLEGIWHAGSPLGMIVNALRGMYVCVPRNMVQAAGMYNTLLQSDDPALVIECLNGYRLKESCPSNLSKMTVPLGQAEVLQEGSDVTLVTYGSCVRVADEALEILKDLDISVELIDVQTLLPFDLEGTIKASLQKTSRLVLLDEDVPGGATAYMMRQIMEVQDTFELLDSAVVTITAKAHRPAYGNDGDYFSKPNPEDIVETICKLMHEVNPALYNVFS